MGPLATTVRGGAVVRFDPTRYSALVGAWDIASLVSASAAQAGNCRGPRCGWRA